MGNYLNSFLIGSDNPDLDSELAFETRGICAAFERCCTPVRTNGVWRISFLATTKRPTNPGNTPIGGVIDRLIKFDANGFFRLNDETKKRVALDALIAGVRGLCRENNWPRKPFDDAYHAVIASGLSTTWTYGKPVKNKARSHEASLEVAQGVKRCEINIFVRGRNSGEVTRAPVGTGRPDELCFAHLLGTLRWSRGASIKFTPKQRRGKPRVIRVKLPAP